MSPQPQIKLYAILAKDAPQAIVFRRGPAKLFATIGWNLADDSFSIGQWLKGVIHIHASDLSPDGKFLLYDAATYRNGSFEKDCYTAISYAPYLHALDFYFHSNIEAGGGFFIDRQSACLPISATGARFPENRRQTNLKLISSTAAWLRAGQTWLSRGLLASGWRQYQTTWRKELPDGRILEKCGLPDQSSAGRETHRLLGEAGAVLAGGADWEWADYDRFGKRIVFAAAGKLFALPSAADSPVPQLLFDLNDLKYSPVAAPYSGPEAADQG